MNGFGTMSLIMFIEPLSSYDRGLGRYRSLLLLIIFFLCLRYYTKLLIFHAYAVYECLCLMAQIFLTNSWMTFPSYLVLLNVASIHGQYYLSEERWYGVLQVFHHRKVYKQSLYVSFKLASLITMDLKRIAFLYHELIYDYPCDYVIFRMCHSYYPLC